MYTAIIDTPKTDSVTKVVTIIRETLGTYPTLKEACAARNEYCRKFGVKHLLYTKTKEEAEKAIA